MKTNTAIGIMISLAVIAAVLVSIMPTNSKLIGRSTNKYVAATSAVPWQSKAFVVTVTNVDKKHWNVFVTTSMGTITCKMHGDTSNGISELVLRNTLLRDKESRLRLATFREVYSLVEQYSMEIRNLRPPDIPVDEQEVFVITTLGSQVQTNEDPIHPCWDVLTNRISGPYFPNGNEGYHKGIYGGKFHLPTLYAYARR